MPFLNSVHLMGHLTNDIELRHLPSGNAVANFTLGVNSGRASDAKARKGEFFPCEVWDAWAQNLAKTARKGSLIVVEGRLMQDRWVDSKTNQPMSRVKVKALRAFHVQAQYPEARPQDEQAGLEEEVSEFGSHAGFESADEAESITR